MDRAALVTALHACLRLFEACGEEAGAAACRRGLAQLEVVARQQHTDLTPREQSVAVLLATGATNAQIAHSLGIARGTVGRHLVNIYAKLGAHRRAQVAGWYAATHADGIAAAHLDVSLTGLERHRADCL